MEPQSPSPYLPRSLPVTLRVQVPKERWTGLQRAPPATWGSPSRTVQPENDVSRGTLRLVSPGGAAPPPAAAATDAGGDPGLAEGNLGHPLDQMDPGPALGTGGCHAGTLCVSSRGRRLGWLSKELCPQGTSAGPPGARKHPTSRLGSWEPERRGRGGAGGIGLCLG